MRQESVWVVAVGVSLGLSGCKLQREEEGTRDTRSIRTVLPKPYPKTTTAHGRPIPVGVSSEDGAGTPALGTVQGQGAEEAQEE